MRVASKLVRFSVLLPMILIAACKTEPVDQSVGGASDSAAKNADDIAASIAAPKAGDQAAIDAHVRAMQLSDVSDASAEVSSDNSPAALAAAAASTSAYITTCKNQGINVPDKLPKQSLKADSNGWKFLGDFAGTEMASSPTFRATMYSQTIGTTTCLYLYRYNPYSALLNGVLCFDTKTCNVCSFDDGVTTPPQRIADLKKIPGTIDDQDRCSKCHRSGPIAPFKAMKNVFGEFGAEPPSIADLNKKCAEVGGPKWIFPQGVTLPTWTQQNPDNKCAAPKPCSDCHTNFFKEKDPDKNYCNFAMNKAFSSPQGSMTANFANIDPQGCQDFKTCSGCTNLVCPAKKPNLKIQKQGTGNGKVTSAPTGIDCGATCDANFNAGSSVTLSQAASAGSTFGGWSGACNGTGACTVTMNDDKIVKAAFNTITYTLTVTKSGSGAGTVSSAPAGINCGTTCAASFASGTVVSLTPSANAGSAFNGWSGACSGTGACQVTMTAAKSVTANFGIKTTQTLTVSKAGTGSGTVTSSPSGISCGATCSAEFANNAVVSLTPTPNSGMVFVAWTGACSGTGACSVTMNAAKSVVATFNMAGYRLLVTKGGTGTGKVTATPGGIDCGNTCSATIQSGTLVSLMQTPDAGSVFGGWQGACTGTTIVCSITMNSEKSVTAIFNRK